MSSTYAYPGFRPELSDSEGTFGIPSFGAFAAYGAGDEALEPLSHWGGRVGFAASAINGAKSRGGPGVGNVLQAETLVFQARQLVNEANDTTGGYRPNAKWTRAQEEKIAGLLEKARVLYNGGAGISSTQGITYPKFPTWRLAQAGVPQGGGVPTDIAATGTLDQIMAGFLAGIAAVNKTKQDEAGDEAAQGGANAGLTPEQQLAAAKEAAKREQDSQRDEIAKTKGLGLGGPVAITAVVLLGVAGLGIWGLTKLFR